MKVRAISRGHDGKRIREAGEVFDYEGKLGSWLAPVEEKKPAKAKDADVKETKAKDADRPKKK